jgi:hypothetical protein
MNFQLLDSCISVRFIGKQKSNGLLGFRNTRAVAAILLRRLPQSPQL